MANQAPKELPPPAELRRRIRAARAYADLTLDDFAADVGIGRNTLVRIDSGERDPKPMELRQMATVAGLPFEFFLVDFDRLHELEGWPLSNAERLEARQEHRAENARRARLRSMTPTEVRGELEKLLAAAGLPEGVATAAAGTEVKEPTVDEAEQIPTEVPGDPASPPEPPDADAATGA